MRLNQVPAVFRKIDGKEMYTIYINVTIIAAIFLVVVLSGCATQQEIKNECQTRVIDHDNRMIMSSIPHSCGAYVAASSSREDIEIDHIKSSPISYIIVKGID